MVSLSSGGDFQWDIKDKAGVSAAKGLYYLRLELKGDFGTMKKIYKILIL